MAPIFAALGDKTRLRIVSRLAKEEGLSIAELTRNTRMTRQAITRHLAILEDAGVVHGARRGREHTWKIERARIAIAQRSLEQISAWWDEKLSAFKASVER